VDGDDIRDADAVMRAAASVDVIVHGAALASQSSGTPEEMTATNLEGSRNVLQAAKAAGHQRAVVFSSAQVFGCATGEGLPDQFPIRDDHRLVARSAYALSKIQSEDLCEQFTREHGIATVCLRPFHVWVPGQAADCRRKWLRDEPAQWIPYWEYGAWVDVRDVAQAVHLSMQQQVQGHIRALLCASDIAATRRSREMAALVTPDVPLDPHWIPDGESWKALVDSGVARKRLGWAPRYTFAAESRKTWFERAWRRIRE
jgi:nucleoside-diphosphate-sugar epimerase